MQNVSRSDSRSAELPESQNECNAEWTRGSDGRCWPARLAASVTCRDDQGRPRRHGHGTFSGVRHNGVPSVPRPLSTRQERSLRAVISAVCPCTSFLPTERKTLEQWEHWALWVIMHFAIFDSLSALLILTTLLLQCTPLSIICHYK